MRVFKFGGASVKDAAAVRNMANIVYQHGIQNQLLVVVSAMGKTTNHLEAVYNAFAQKQDYKPHLEELKQFHLTIARDLFKEEDAPIFDLLDRLFARIEATVERQDPATAYDEGYDQIVSFGEVISTHIVAHYLRTIDANAVWVDARQYIQTDSTWREAKIDWVWTESIISTEVARLLQNHVVITQGFIGGTLDGKTSTLGREGSDYTAAIFASCLKAESLTIWKDVSGVLSADPKKFPQAELYHELSYADAVEMTYYGATVIHPKTIRPIANQHIPLHVRSFVQPEAKGTVISEGRQVALAPAIIHKANQTLLEISTLDLGFIAERHLVTLLELLGRLNIKVNLLQVTAVKLLLVVDSDERKLDKLQANLPKELDKHETRGLDLYTLLNPDAALEASIVGNSLLKLSQRTENALQLLVHKA